jgi:hypothetical protein
MCFIFYSVCTKERLFVEARRTGFSVLPLLSLATLARIVPMYSRRTEVRSSSVVPGTRTFT